MFGSVQFNSEEFAFEEFEGEILVLNLMEGTYFALGGSAPLFWTDLSSGASLQQITSKLHEATGTPEDEIANSLKPFVDQLLAEQVLLPSDESTEPEYYAYVTSKFSNVMLVIDPKDGVDAEIVGRILLADRDADSDDRIIGYDGFGGQGVLAIPNVYDGWVDNLPSEWPLSNAQKDP